MPLSGKQSGHEQASLLVVRDLHLGTLPSRCDDLQQARVPGFLQATHESEVVVMVVAVLASSAVVAMVT